MARSISVDMLADAIGETVSSFAREVEEQADRAVEAAARACASELRGTSPELTGEYAAGWTASVERDALGSVTATVHNDAKPSLTHLLEFGHGGPHPAGAHPHIGPAADEAISDLIRRL